MSIMLVTGFDPFGGEKVNPSFEAVRLLPERIGKWKIEKAEIPTVFGLCSEKLFELTDSIRPDAVLLTGQAGGSEGVRIEQTAVNLRDARMPDNGGKTYWNAPVDPAGPKAYFTTIPAHDIVPALKDAFPVRLSYSAGAYVCNDLFYAALRRFEHTAVQVGFVHVPFLPEQAKDRFPSMPLAEIARVLEAIIREIP